MQTTLEIVQVPIDDLRPDPANPRRISDVQLEALTRSLQEFGFVQPVLARRDTQVVIGGHQRLTAARRLGFTHVPVIWLDVDDEHAKVLNLALNRIGGEWDQDLLASLLASLRPAPIDMTLSGFADDELKKLLGRLGARAKRDRPEAFDLDAALDAARRAPRAAPGDVWLLGAHRLLCGDSTDEAAVRAIMAGGRAAAMWTDPPYGVSYVGKTPAALTIRNDGDDVGALLADVFTLATAALEPGAPFYVCRPHGVNSLAFGNAIVAVGWSFHEELQWLKDAMVLGHSDYHSRHETIIYGWTKGPGRSGRGKHQGSRWYGDNAQDTVFAIDRPKASREHPTMKPIELIEAMLKNSTRDGDVVFEPFAGSGSTIIACERMNRACRAIEIDPTYCDVAITRWEAFSGQEAERESSSENSQKDA